LCMNRALLAHCRLMHTKVDILAAGTVPQRLAALFLDLAERFGDEDGEGTHYVPLALSRSHIASYIGARVETVIRCCSAWQKRGVLSTDRNGFVIADPGALRDIARGVGIKADEASAA
jgi:CRP/FNR family transcriptional regulator, nitrogen oxide reductase regulator